MTIQDDIFLTILQAKDVSSCWAENFIDKAKYGGDDELDCCEMKLMLLVRWIRIIENYYAGHFGANGNITPALTYLTLAQAQELLAKIRTMIKA